MNEEIEKQLSLLERVAEKLKNGLITSGNIAHDGKVQGYTIENVVGNIRKVLNKEAIIAVELAKQEAMEEVEAYLNELIEKNSGKSYSDTFLPPLYSVLGFIKSKTKKEG